MIERAEPTNFKITGGFRPIGLGIFGRMALHLLPSEHVGGLRCSKLSAPP